MIKKISHVSVTTDNLDKSVEFYKTLGFTEGKSFTENDPMLKAVFMEKDSMGLEIFEFEDLSDPKAKIIQNHTALISDDLESDIELFEEYGYAVAIPIKDGVTVKRYVFLKDEIGNAVELIEI